jgi:hypothetical protein
MEAEKKVFFNTPEYHNRMEEAEVQLQLELATGSRIDQSTRSGIN